MCAHLNCRVQFVFKHPDAMPDPLDTMQFDFNSKYSRTWFWFHRQFSELQNLWRASITQYSQPSAVIGQKQWTEEKRGKRREEIIPRNLVIARCTRFSWIQLDLLFFIISAEFGRDSVLPVTGSQMVEKFMRCMTCADKYWPRRSNNN